MIVRFSILLIVILFSNSSCSNKSQSTESQSNAEISQRIKLPSGEIIIDDQPHFTIKVDKNGQVFFKGAVNDADYLKLKIDSLPFFLAKSYAKDTTIKTVIYEGTPNSNYSSFVKVIHIAEKLGMKVSINVKEE